MAIITYSRVSTNRQDNQNQEHYLKERYPNATAYRETASGIKVRPVLDWLTSEGLKDGDTLVVAALDRLGRRCSEVLQLIEDLQKRNINVVSLRECIDYSTPMGRLVTQILSSVAEMEREVLSQRTKDALQAKKAQGVRLGAPIKHGPDAIAKAKSLRSQGKSYREIRKLTGMSLDTISRALKCA